MLWIFLGMTLGMAHYVRSPSPQRTAAAPELGGSAPASVRGQALPPLAGRPAGRVAGGPHGSRRAVRHIAGRGTTQPLQE